ncbi:MAG TPA: response regulator transcription factor [Dongiaceae bacterium]|nr:response regulator transcription factor [Dongiaceae bacterium]
MNKASHGDRCQRSRILVADNDQETWRTFVTYLEDCGMRAIFAAGRQEILRQVTTAELSLVILDLVAEPESGLDLLGEIRSLSNLPIIVTGSLQPDDCAAALELGADAVVVKPCSGRELYARVRNLLRLRVASCPSRQPFQQHRFEFGGWQLDLRSRHLTAPDGSRVVLTKAEFALLATFIRAPNRLFTREQLLNAVRVHPDVFDRSIDSQVFRLRRKLEVDPSRPKIIRTERGVGYVFTLKVRSPASDGGCGR